MQKGRERIRQLVKLMGSGKLNQNDWKVANQLIAELKRALNGNKGAVKMNRETLIKYFLNNFPEYRDAFEQHSEDYDEILIHVFFGDTINERLIELLENDKVNSKEIEKIFKFLEKMVLDGDLDIKEVLTVIILERLGDDKNLLEKSYKYMGENTKIASIEIEKFWGRL